MSSVTGHVEFQHCGETFQTWFKVVGDLESEARPLLLLHGGPAIPNPYLDPHTRLHTERGIPVIFYDQIGCGKSTHLKDKPASFFTLDLFMDELANLIVKLGIADNFDLYGHSWGGMLAADFAATRRPKGLKRLILANTPSSIPLFVKNVEKLLENISPGLAERVRKHEQEGTTDDREYKDTAAAFMKRYVVSMDPYPKDVAEALEAFGQDKTVHNALWGTYEFSVKGNLETYSVIDKLSDINVPTLVLNGVNDEVQDEVIVPFVEKITKVKWVRFEQSGHMPFYEERERYFEVVGNFLV